MNQVRLSMNQMKKLLPWALGLVFLMLGLIAFFESKPVSKNERIYMFVKTYSPYYIEKRFGGLQIQSRENTEFKDKPSNMALFKELESLEMKWGQKHLRIEGNALLVLDQNASVVDSLPILTNEELTFIHSYYGI